MTLIFLLLLKKDKSYRGVINYFIIQESLGLIFLVFRGGLLQILILLIKVGVTPFHFWIFSITSNIFNWNLVWFLTFQKFPFLPVLLQLISFLYLFLFLLGILVIYFQLFLSKGLKVIIVLSSVESFNWILLCCLISLINFFYLVFFYIIIIVFLIVSVLKSEDVLLDWELVLVFINIPFRITFFVKIFSLAGVFVFNRICVLLLLFIIFLSILSFSFWFIFVSIYRVKDFVGNLNYISFIVLPLMVICLLYWVSKIYYIILIR